MTRRIIGIVLAVVAAAVVRSAPLSEQQSAAPRRPPSPSASEPGSRVVFEIRTSVAVGAGSNDLILIVFSDRSADTPLVPSPLLGEDIVREFAFSARDARQ